MYNKCLRKRTKRNLEFFKNILEVFDNLMIDIGEYVIPNSLLFKSATQILITAEKTAEKAQA